MKQSSSNEQSQRRTPKKATSLQETRTTTSLKTRRRRRRRRRRTKPEVQSNGRGVIRDHLLPEESEQSVAKNNSEERKEMHRVHERLRHQNLNGAIKELVETLPAEDASRSVTKYNVLQKADKYIDFLQHKITCLCLERSIKHETQDGRLSFNVPFTTVVDGEKLQIPALIPISPQSLKGIHKTAKSISSERPEVGLFTGNQTEWTSPVRRCRFKLKKKKSPRAGASGRSGPKAGRRSKRREERRQASTASSSVQPPAENLEDRVPGKTDTDLDDLVINESSPLQSDLSSQGFDESVSWKPPVIRPIQASNMLYQTENGGWLKNEAGGVWPPSSSSLSSMDQEGSREPPDRCLNDDPPLNGWCGFPLIPTEVLPPAGIPDSDLSLPDLEVFSAVNPFNAFAPRPLIPSDHSYSTSFLSAFGRPGFPAEACLPDDVVLTGAGSAALEESARAPLPREAANIRALLPSPKPLLCPTNNKAPGVLTPALYSNRVPISQPTEPTGQESSVITVTLGCSSTAAPAGQSRASLLASSTKSTLRFVPIQPATSAPPTVAMARASVPCHAGHPASSLLQQTNQATVASAQRLVADPHCLQFEGSAASLEIACGDSSASITTPTASSGCPVRRSWINGYQLFTKVNHPRFREKWPRLQGREITRLLSQAWKELPGSFKKNYSQRAREWNQWHRSKRELANQES